MSELYNADTFSEPYVPTLFTGHIPEKLYNIVPVQTYTEHLRKHPHYLNQFNEIENTRRVNIAEQTVSSLIEYIEKSKFTKTKQIEILNFLFTDRDEQNNLWVQYIEAIGAKDSAREAQIDELRTEAKRLENLKSELLRQKSKLNRENPEKKNIEDQEKETRTLHKESENKIKILEAEKTAYYLKAEYYECLCERLALAKARTISGRLKYKNTEFTNKLLFLLELYPDLIPQKSQQILVDRIGLDGGFNIGILTKQNAFEVIAAGVTTPCCLSLPATGTKFLNAIIFNPNVSLATLKNNEGKLIATALVIYDENSITLLHVDTSKDFFGDEKKQAVENANKRLLVKDAFTRLSGELAKNTKLPVYLAPGEATLENFGTPVEALCGINQILKNPELWRNEVSEELVGASVKSGRTDVGNYNWFAYSLENSDNLTQGGKDVLAKFITEQLGTEFQFDRTQVSTAFNSLIEDDGGHGLCKLRFKSHDRKLEIEPATKKTNQKLL